MKPHPAAVDTVFFSAAEIRHARRQLARPGPLGDRAREIVRRADELLRTAAPAAWIEAERPLSPAWVASACPLCSRKDRWCGWSGARPAAVRCNHCGASFPNARCPEDGRDVVEGTVYPYHLSPAGTRYYFSGVARGRRFLEAVRVLHPELPLAWLLTGDPRYAKPVLDVLKQLGRVYSGWPLLHDAVDSPAHAGTAAVVRHYHFPDATFAYRTRLWQWVEAALLFEALMAYDAVRSAPQHTRADEVLIRDGYVRHALEGFVVNKLLFMHSRFHNSFGDYLSGMVLAGRVFGNALRVRDLMGGAFEMTGGDLVREALDGPAGIRQFLLNAYGPDGIYYENTYTYHVHALKVMLPAMLALRGYRDPAGYRPDPWLTPTPRSGAFDLRRALAAYPAAVRGFDRFLRADYRGVPDNDSFGDLLADQSAYLHMTSWRLMGRRADGAVARAILGRNGGQERTERLGCDRFFFDNYLLFGGRLPASRGGERLSSEAAGSGFAVLRHGAASLHMSWDEPRQYHSHADQLGIQFFSHGREMLVDLGYMGAGHPMRHVWLDRTIAHNTVVIDGRNQRAWPDAPAGRLLRFHASRTCAVAEAESAGCHGKARRYRRLVALVGVGASEHYAVDLFHVEGGRRHDYALLANGDRCDVRGVAQLPMPGTLAGRNIPYVCAEEIGPEQRARENGYRFIDDLAGGRVRGEGVVARAHWSMDKGGQLTAHIAAAPGDRIVTGRYPILRGHAWHADPERLRKGRMLVVRRSPGAGGSLFASILSPGDGGGCVRSVECLDADHAGRILRVVHTRGTDVLLAAVPGSRGPTWRGYATDAPLALARYDARGRLHETAVFGGTRLDLPGLGLRLGTPLPWRVVETFDSENRLRLDRPFNARAGTPGEVVTVESGDRQYVFRVRKARGRTLWLDARHSRLIGAGGVVGEVLSATTLFTATPMVTDLQPGSPILIGRRRFHVRSFERTGTGPDLRGIYRYDGRRGCRIAVREGGLTEGLRGAEFLCGVVVPGSRLSVSPYARVTPTADGMRVASNVPVRVTRDGRDCPDGPPIIEPCRRGRRRRS